MENTTNEPLTTSNRRRLIVQPDATLSEIIEILNGLGIEQAQGDVDKLPEATRRHYSQVTGQ